jgi:hypothetical protein
MARGLVASHIFLQTRGLCLAHIMHSAVEMQVLVSWFFLQLFEATVNRGGGATGGAGGPAERKDGGGLVASER